MHARGCAVNYGTVNCWNTVDGFDIIIAGMIEMYGEDAHVGLSDSDQPTSITAVSRIPSREVRDERWL